MGRSRREKVVALTKTRKRMQGRNSKEAVVQEVRDLIDKYERIYVFSALSMRNVLMKSLREKWYDSTFYFGRKRLVQIAMGNTVQEEYKEGLHKIAEHVQGSVALLFTNRDHPSVVKFFNEYSVSDFARSGFQATEGFEVKKGALDQFDPSQVQNLRLTGLPVDLKKGVVRLEEDFTVCEAGETLTPEKAKILEFMGVRMAKACIKLLSCYEKKTGQYEELSSQM